MRITLNKALTDSPLVEMRKKVDPATSYDDGEDVVILAASEKWVLSRTFIEGIEADGYTVTSREFIDSLETNKYLTFRTKALQADKAWQHTLTKPSIDLESTASVLGSLGKLDQYVILLCETFETWQSLHCRIDEVTPESVIVLGFDGAGKWEKKHVSIPLKDITQIRFSTVYLRFYQKHLPQ